MKAAQTEPKAPLMTAQQVATYLNCGESTVYRWALLKQIPSIRVGKRCLRFQRDAVDAFVQAGIPEEPQPKGRRRA